MKTLFLLLALTVTTSVTVYSQSFKVSGVESADNKYYDKLSIMLGKKLTLTFYDNSLTMEMEGEGKTYNLKKESSSLYRRVEKSEYSVSTFTLKLNTTFSYINSAEITFSEVYNTGKLKVSGKVTAKRQ